MTADTPTPAALDVYPPDAAAPMPEDDADATPQQSINWHLADAVHQAGQGSHYMRTGAYKAAATAFQRSGPSYSIAYLTRALVEHAPDAAAGVIKGLAESFTFGDDLTLAYEWLGESGIDAEPLKDAGIEAAKATGSTPLAARWDNIVTRDEDGTAWVLCTTRTGPDFALVLDEEHAEALAGSLLDTPDGEEVAPSADDVRDRIAIMLYSPPDPYTVPGWARAQDVARHQADAVMDAVAPALAAKDAKIAELEEQLAASTWPSRADRRLADDARPTTRGGR